MDNIVKLICIKSQYMDDETLCDFRKGNTYYGEILRDNKILVAGNHGDSYIFEDNGKGVFEITESY